MIYFNCDYNEGAHPAILEMLEKTNWEQTIGYGMDPYCEKARELIRRECRAPEADVHFLVGGTQTNTTAVSSVLRPHQGVISAESGHIQAHETGAIEACGHRVITVPSKDGKITAEQIHRIWTGHWEDSNHEHMVQPKMVYLSHPTESGTLYSLEELKAVSNICRACGMYLYLDGARLGYGICARDSTVSLPDISRLCDIFYIGGTKQGALFGEALVITNTDLKPDFRYFIKQKGGMLAKGRLLGLQFIALFEDGIYYQIAEHADRMADCIREACVRKGIPFLFETKANQLFSVLTHSQVKKLEKEFVLSLWEKLEGDRYGMRICTSWATTEEQVQALTVAIDKL